MKVLDLGLESFNRAYSVQKDILNKVRFGEDDETLIMVEHKPVYTIGRLGSNSNLLVSKERLMELGIQVVMADRGGDITFHGPGQIVLYPIIDLRKRLRDLHKYIRDLEQVAINYLERYSIRGERIAGKTGVWVGNAKIASIGISASDWVTFHGLAINVNTDLSYYSMINPCGMKDVVMTSLECLLKTRADIPASKKQLVEDFNKVFYGASCLA